MKKNDVLELEVTDLAFGGKGIAHHEGMVIFVEQGLPGQQVKVRIKKRKKDYAEAIILSVLKTSPYEQEIPYQRVPGAPWAQFAIQKQIQAKREQVFDLFIRFARQDVTMIFDEMIPSPMTWLYRNKMEYSFGPTHESAQILDDGSKVWEHHGFGLGFKVRGQYWLVKNLDRPSGIFDEGFEKLIPQFRAWCEATGLPAYNQRTHEGFFRFLVVRKSFEQDKILMNLVTTSHHKDTFLPSSVMAWWREKLGDRLGGLFWTQYDGVGDTASRSDKRDLLFGEPTLLEHMNGLGFEISMDSFFQTNVFSAEKLYAKVVEYAQLQGGERALDLFCGTGTIGQILAKYAPDAQIEGVELVEAAVADAHTNAKRNELTNIQFTAADAYAYLRKVAAGHFDLVVVDPPRSGIGKKALERIMTLAPKRIVYVSCNPSTMVRDVALFKNANYKLTKLSLVDQFPHTPHVEAVGVLDIEE